MNTSSTTWIPNIVVGQEYDRQYADAPIHYDSLRNFASHFGYDMPVHRHAEFLQIHYIEQGHVDFHIDDLRFQADGPACFVTPASLPHSFRIEESTNGHVVTIQQSLIWTLFQDGMPIEFESNLKSGFCIAEVDLEPTHFYQWQIVQQTLRSFKEEWEHDKAGKSLVLEAFARTLLISLLRMSPKTRAGTELIGNDFRIFRAFSDAIEALYTQHKSVKDYTAKIGVSESHLNQVCHRICQSSPKRLINDRLLREARRLLTHSDISCTEICYTLGFSDPSYFSRFFKKHTGQTAQQYRSSQNR